MENGDGAGFDCANNTSDVLKILDFKHTMTPCGLEQQLKHSEKVVGRMSNFSDFMINYTNAFA